MEPEPFSGAVKKDWRGRLSVALAFPAPRDVGMASLGFQAVYGLLNTREDVVCERVFLPGKGPALSEESGRRLTDFDLAAFSLSFENDFPNLLAILEQGGVPILARDRNASRPLVVAGGIVSGLNPEPLAPFVDVFLIGEAEELLPPFLSRLDPAADREELLAEIAAHVPGAYVPSLYRPVWSPDGRLVSMEPVAPAPARVRRVYCKNLSDFSTVSRFPPGQPGTFESTVLVEVSRGCPHGCRFCAAGHVTRPPRFRPVDRLERDILTAAAAGETAGMLGAAVSDLPGLPALCRLAKDHGLRLSFSSLRADAMTPELCAAVAESRVKTATLAPDAGSERMRRIIRKGITEQDVLGAAGRLVEAGVLNLKLYFMLGLPWETSADVDAVVELTLRVKEAFLAASRPRGRMGGIRVSISSFVPKAHTPFQWAPMDTARSLKEKAGRIRHALRRVPNVTVTADVPRMALVQGLLSRGDRRVAEILLLAHKNQGNWPKTLKESTVDPNFYTLRERDADELFPWDMIDHGMSKSRLRVEWEKAREEAGE